jgi:hypothetical protein
MFLRWVGGGWGPNRLSTPTLLEAELHTTVRDAEDAGREYGGMGTFRVLALTIEERWVLGPQVAP